jgi:hypothetical protein
MKNPANWYYFLFWIPKRFVDVSHFLLELKMLFSATIVDYP